MAYSYDFFVAEMKCPVCGAISPADDSTEMYTYIRKQPAGEFLGVGSPLDIDPDLFDSGEYDGYLKIRAPEPGGAIRLLNPWRCPTNGSYNWARIEVRDGVIVAITPVTLDRATLESSELISNEADFLAASLLGLPAGESADKDTVRILREHLP